MAQQPRLLHSLPANLDDQVVIPLAPRRAAVVSRLPAREAGPPRARPLVGIRRRAIRQVTVLEVASRLTDVVVELDHAIQLALALGPRGVVCDLSDLVNGADEPHAMEVLASAGRHVRDWSGVPLAVACPDPRVRETLRAHPLGGHLIVTESLFGAVTAVLSGPSLTVQSLHLAAHPTAPRASREFVTRTLLDWRLNRVIPFASLVVSELVASSSVHAGTDIDLSVVWDRGALRLCVQDRGPALPGQQPSTLDLRGRALTVVAGLSRAFGIMSTAEGGNVAWAVLDAPATS